jgi:hypothetical protein
MKAIALLVLAVALEAGFLLTLALPAAELDAAREAASARAARVELARAPAPAPSPVPARS